MDLPLERKSRIRVPVKLPQKFINTHTFFRTQRATKQL